MGSNCCKQKEDSPRSCLRKVFFRIFPQSSRTVKIVNAERRRSSQKRPSVSDPVFLSSTNEERNHVTLMLPDAPRIPPRKKKPRLAKKRVSFQSDVDILRMSSSKSLDGSVCGESVSEQARPRSRSLDSLMDARKSSSAGLNQGIFKNRERRTSSLEQLPTMEDDETQSWLARIRRDTLVTFKAMKEEERPDNRLTAKLRRDTLGNALDLHGYRRPVIDQVLAEHDEEPEGILEEEDEEVDSSLEDILTSSLPSKLRRDTLALNLREDVYSSQELRSTDSSCEDLEKKMNNSRLCSKLRRDTFGDALREAVHCKACTSYEDITEIEASSEPRTDIDRSKSAWLQQILKDGESPISSKAESNNNHVKTPKKVSFTDEDLVSALERIRAVRVEPKSDYTVVYCSANRATKENTAPIPSISVTTPTDSRRSSVTESLKEFESTIYDMLQDNSEEAKPKPLVT